MKTKIKFGMLPETRELLVKEAINILLNGYSKEQKQDAIDAVCNAFHSADNAAGNGMFSYSDYTSKVGYFRADANIDTGEFHLYQNVEKIDVIVEKTHPKYNGFHCSHCGAWHNVPRPTCCSCGMIVG